LMIWASPWRRERIFAYLDPFSEDHALGKGYQLSHALIAIGRGEVFGVGLGGSIEKLHWLPEAHTDFIFSVITEEMGLIFGSALVLGLIGISAGTLYQKRHAAAIDLRTGLFIQNAVGSLAMLALAAPLEGLHTDLSAPFWMSLAWVVLVNSVGGFALLFMLIRHGEAPKVAALFYLVPPVTALMSRVSMHETLSAPEVAGFALATLGVYLGSKS